MGGGKKTEGLTVMKSRGGSLAVGTYLQRDSAPTGHNPFVEYTFREREMMKSDLKYQRTKPVVSDKRHPKCKLRKIPVISFVPKFACGSFFC